MPRKRLRAHASHDFAQRSLLAGLVDQLGPREGMLTFLDLTGLALGQDAEKAAHARRKQAALWSTDRYAPMRHAAWAFRNCRPRDQEATLEKLRDTAQQLLAQGEHSAHVLEALLELTRSR